MRWLSRATLPLKARLANESGATMVFIAVVLIGLMAMTAFVIDFGRIWQERRELQLGATAAALAIGEDCARDLCDGTELSTAEQYADANATDGAAAVRDMALDPIGQTVYVATGTENTSGGATMGMLFAGIIGFDTASIGADATVAWGSPLNAKTLPLIISDCEWLKSDAGWPAGGLRQLPDADADLSGVPLATITLHEGPFVPDDLCTIQPGLDLPGGFGWVDTSSGCLTEVAEGSWNSAKPGNPPPNACDPDDFADLLGEPVLIPYFSAVQGSGSPGRYEVAGLAAFVIAGYDFGGQYKAGPVSCSAATSCLSGWFVNYVSHGGGPGGLGGTDRGVIVIKLIG